MAILRFTEVYEGDTWPDDIPASVLMRESIVVESEIEDEIEVGLRVWYLEET